MVADKGYGLSDEDEQDEVKEDVEVEEVVDKKDIPVKYDDIKMIISERNKLHHEINIRVPEYKERIGRLNLDLFGDPENPDWESKLDILKAELDHPMTKTHPIASKTNAVVKEIKDLQIEYKALHKFYERYVKEMGTLLDGSIKLCLMRERIFQGRDNTLTGRKTTVDRSPVPSSSENLTVAVVERLMKEGGGAKYIEDYIRAFDAGDFNMARSAMGSFITKAKAFFKSYHPDPKFAARKVFLKYTQGRVLKKDTLKKIKADISSEEGTEQSQAKNEGLIENGESEEGGEGEE